ncbi:MAG: T9SS type A sorting domain-containing protein [Bacteroidota bacterium]
MKQISIIFFCLFMSGVTFAQPTYQDYYDLKSYGEYPGHTLIPLSDGSVVTLSRAAYTTHPTILDIHFVKLDPRGNVLIQKKLSTDYSSGDVMGITTKDSGYILFMSQGWGDGLIKLNSKGVVEWAKYYTSSLTHSLIPNAIIECKSGGYIIQYNLSDDYYVTNQTGIMKVSPTGDMIWNTPLEPYKVWYWEYFGTALLEGSNGTIYVGGYLQTEDPFQDYHSTIMELSADGVYQKGLFFYSHGWGFRLQRLFQVNGELVIYGSYYAMSLNIDSGRYVVGNEMYYQTFLNKYPSLLPQQFDGVGYYKDGSIIKVTGGGITQGASYDIIVRKYDSLYRTCPDYIPNVYTLNYSIRSQMKKLQVLPVSDVITVSDLNVYDSAVNFVKIFCAGNVPPSLTSKLPLQKNISKISIYPNPSDNELHVLNLNAEEKYQLTIMNNLGNVFKQYSVENNTSFDFNLNGLKAGVYYLKVQSGKTNSSYMFIKK